MHFESTKKPRGLLSRDRTLFCPIWRRPKSSSRTEDNLSKLAASDADGFGFAAAILFILATPYARMLLMLTISSIPLRLLLPKLLLRRFYSRRQARGGRQICPNPGSDAFGSQIYNSLKLGPKIRRSFAPAAFCRSRRSAVLATTFVSAELTAVPCRARSTGE